MSSKKKADEEKRRKLLAIVHIAKKQMRVCEHCGEVCFSERCRKCGRPTRTASDFDYRRFLKEITGQHSAAHLTEWQLSVVVEELVSRGFVVVKKSSLYEAANLSRLAMAERIRYEARRRLGDNYKKRIRGFCRKSFGKDDLKFCSIGELRKVWGFLRRVKE